MKISSFFKKITLISFSGYFLFVVNLNAQTTFYKTYDTPADDYGVFVEQTNDGGFIIAGNTDFFGSGGYDAWILKTDANGDTLWSKTYGGINDDDAQCIRQTSDGGYIVAGKKHEPGENDKAWVFKTDNTGNLAWEYTFGGDSYFDNAKYILPVSGNEFLIVANIDSHTRVLKMDENGNVLWEHSYFTGFNNKSYSACRYGVDNFAVAGSFQLNKKGLWYPNLTVIDNDGNLVTQVTWTQYEGGFYAITPAKDNGILMGGSGNFSPLLIRMSSDDYLWEYSYDATGDEAAINSLVETGGGFVATSAISGFLLKVNDNGEEVWVRDGLVNGDEVFYTSILKTDDNALVMAGRGRTEPHDHQIILVKTTIDGSMAGLDNNNFVSSAMPDITTAPNPFAGKTEIKFYVPQDGNVQIYVSDNGGKIINNLTCKFYNKGNHSVVWDGNSNNGTVCKAGVYYITVKTGNFIKTVKSVKTLK